MFKFIARLFGLLLIAAALVAGIADATRSIASSSLVMTPLGKTWYDIDAGSLNLSQAVIERHVWPPLWDPVMITVLQQPTWLVLLVLGALFLLLGAKRRAREIEET
jgi:hypothetical protein